MTVKHSDHGASGPLPVVRALLISVVAAGLLFAEARSAAPPAAGAGSGASASISAPPSLITQESTGHTFSLVSDPVLVPQSQSSRKSEDNGERGAGAAPADTLTRAAPAVSQHSLWGEGEVLLPQERYRAGELCGVPFYWHHEPFRSDTLRWSSLPSQGVFYTLGDPTALDVAILIRCGFRIFFLSRWSGSVDLGGRDVRGALEDRTMVTPFLWEEVVAVQVHPPEGKRRDRQVWLRSDICGNSLRSGGASLAFARMQILGTRGLSLDEKSRGYIPEKNQHRVVTAILVHDPGERDFATVVREIESYMDGEGLEIGIRVPRLIGRSGVRP